MTDSNGRIGRRKAVLWSSSVLFLGIGASVLAIQRDAVEHRVDWIIRTAALTAVLLAATVLATSLVSLWSYGAAAALRSGRPDAVLVRSGATAPLRSALDERAQLRASLNRARPMGFQFLLVADPSGIEIWHGAAKTPTGSIRHEKIRRLELGRIHEGIWTVPTLEITVLDESGEVILPFVLRTPEGIWGVGKARSGDTLVAFERALDLPTNTEFDHQRATSRITDERESLATDE